MALPGLPGMPIGYGWPTSESQSQGQSTSQSYIPDYSQTPILNSIAQYAENMAPQVYNWGMEQFGRNQGDINTLMRNALSYASPQRIASDMGMAEAGVQQAGEASRQSALRDLESYGIDPSSGRYAALDQANRVQSAASAAGAGNQQRMADIAQGTGMQEQAISAGLQNTGQGYGAVNAMNSLLSTGMQLKYPPLGNQAQSTNTSQSIGYSSPGGGGGGGGTVNNPNAGLNRGPPPGYTAAGGGYFSQDKSPSHGSEVDDIPANLTAGEFVIPKDVVEYKGKEFFYKLMAAARKNRAVAGGEKQARTGYGHTAG